MEKENKVLTDEEALELLRNPDIRELFWMTVKLNPTEEQWQAIFDKIAEIEAIED